jgi:hypothetical protein
MAATFANLRNVVLAHSNGFAEDAGRDPDPLLNANQLPIYAGAARAAVEAPMMEWLGPKWDYAAWCRTISAPAGRSQFPTAMRSFRPSTRWQDPSPM